MPKKYTITEIEGQKIRLSNLSKILYPSVSITKAHLIQYYITVAPFMLPLVSERPMTLIRYPNGIHAEKFYSKNRPDWTPDWVTTLQVDPSDDNIYLVVNNKATLAWLANLSSLEYHPMIRKPQFLGKPDHFIFDLDPDEQIDFEQLKNVALDLKSFLENLGFIPYVKTSGSKGLHIYVPIHPNLEQEEVIKKVKNVAIEYVKSNPITTLNMSKYRRRGKILIDILRNSKSQTCVAPYSTRGKKGCPISTPLLWNELHDIKSSDQFNILNIKDRLDKVGNVWKDFWENARLLDSCKLQEEKIIKNVADIKTNTLIDISHSPMLASMGRDVPSNENYFFEIKWDGIRVLIIKIKDKVTIKSRHGNDITKQFPSIVEHCKNINAITLIVDGEIVVLDRSGLPDFGKTVGRLHLHGKRVIEKAAQNTLATVYLFDCLYMNGIDVRTMGIEERRTKLKKCFVPTDHLRYSDSFDNGEALLEAVRNKDMEGIMCKKRGSIYQSNQRSKDWLKVKIRSLDTAYIIGYTEGNGDRTKYFGSLHLGKKVDDTWVYKGKVGTGFSSDMLKDISRKLKSIDTTQRLLPNRVEEESKTTWIVPKYKAQIRYSSLTPNQTYREPVFLSLKKVEK